MKHVCVVGVGRRALDERDERPEMGTSCSGRLADAQTMRFIQVPMRARQRTGSRKSSRLLQRKRTLHTGHKQAGNTPQVHEYRKYRKCCLAAFLGSGWYIELPWRAIRHSNTLAEETLELLERALTIHCGGPSLPCTSVTTTRALGSALQGCRQRDLWASRPRADLKREVAHSMLLHALPPVEHAPPDSNHVCAGIIEITNVSFPSPRVPSPGLPVVRADLGLLYRSCTHFCRSFFF